LRLPAVAGNLTRAMFSGLNFYLLRSLTCAMFSPLIFCFFLRFCRDFIWFKVRD